MDNTDSEMIESLNILRPPVRRDYKTSRFGYQPNAVNFMSEWRKPKKRINGGKRIRRGLNSSTSLILKRAFDSQIFDRNPVVSYTNTSIQRQQPAPSVVKFDVKEKPLIKVIVVPNDQPSEGKQSEINKLTRIFHNNSGDNNAIETKNVYLVVAGRKKDKIYEIKTTESDTIPTTELKHEAVNKVFNGDCFKQIIKSLNMEKKKTIQIPDDEIEISHVCKCSGTCKGQNFNNNEPIREIDAGRSKVRIYGQLGLTEDDRYILKCSATVDDKPVPTTFSTVGQKAPDDLATPQKKQTQPRIFKESNVQADAKFEQHRTSPQAKISSPPANDNLPRRSQPKDMSPRMTRESQRRPIEPVNDMGPRRTQQTQRRINDSPPVNDMEPRRTQQTQRRIHDSLSGNDIRTQQSQRWMDESSPENYMDPRKTRESQRKPLACPTGNPLECRDGREVMPSGTHESARRNVYRETRNVGPRKTVLEERYNSHDSQATQANLKNYSNNDYFRDNYANNNAHKSHPSTKDKNTQCSCNCVDAREIKGTQSPLVIISVYPNPDVECKQASVSKNVEANIYESPPAEFSEVQRRSTPRQPNKHVPVATALKDADIQEYSGRSRAFIRKSYRMPTRSPTPQNMRNKNINDQNKVIETRMVNTKARSQSPFKMQTNKSSVRSNPSRTIKKQELKKTTVSKQKFTASTKNSKNTQISKTKSKSRSKDKSNGNQTKSKSLVADKHKKAINERVEKYNRNSPKHNVSAVSINIESENEYYDVTFHRGKYTTDLLVRKGSKNIEKQNDSTVNFLPKSKKSVPIDHQQSTDNFPNNDPPMDEISLKLNPRDSLEISHRHTLRTGIETQTQIELNNSVSKDDTHFFAPVKHFTGDNCSICDPLARDREIQQLLGVSRRVVSSQITDVQKDMFGCKKIITQQCFSDERECKDILYSNIDFVDSLCSCCCVRRSCCRNFGTPLTRIKYKKCSAKNIKRNATEKHQVKAKPIETKESSSSEEIVEKVVKPKRKSEEKQKKTEKQKKEKSTTENEIVERKEPTVERTSLYQQLTLNRNIHIFLQVEQFCKQKPITLSKKQYDKVKKTIQDTLSKNKPLINKKSNKIKCECDESLISIGEVRRKTKQQELENDECEMQTEAKPAVKRSLCKSLSLLSKKSWFKTKECFQMNKKDEKVDTVILYSRDIQSREQANFKIGARQTMSSLEVGYASIAYLKHVTFSSIDAFDSYFEPLPSESSLALKDPISIETLFKGHKKSPTPNLGTSTLSCVSEPGYSASPKLFERPNQAKRPFLKRLISCLVMRSDKTRPIPTLMPPKNAPTVDSSFDSYYFSTSLGAIEMSSSLYDTSASFFSNHSVYPKNNKMKRGFLNSMRGFLHNKRS